MTRSGERNEAIYTSDGGTTTVAVPQNSDTQLTLYTVRVTDPLLQWNGTQFQPKSPGVYYCRAGGNFQTNSNGNRKLLLYLNGAVYCTLAVNTNPGNTNGEIYGSAIIRLKTTDIVTVYAFETGVGGGLTFGSGTATSNQIQIQKLSD
jgi:uncharacterized protein (DUF2147 family)